MAVGDIVTVKITVNSEEKDGFYGVVVDELPSGLIPINTALKNNASGGYSGRYYDYYYNDSMEITENGAIFSARYLNRNNIGTDVFQYKAQVISEGTFYVPPANVSLMYDPEVYGRTNSEVVVVGEESVLLPLEKISKKFENNLFRVDKRDPLKNKFNQENNQGLIAVVTLNLLLLLMYGFFHLIKNNVSAVQIKDGLLGYARFVAKSLMLLLKKNKVTRDKP